MFSQTKLLADKETEILQSVQTTPDSKSQIIEQLEQKFSEIQQTLIDFKNANIAKIENLDLLTEQDPSALDRPRNLLSKLEDMANTINSRLASFRTSSDQNDFSQIISHQSELEKFQREVQHLDSAENFQSVKKGTSVSVSFNKDKLLHALESCILYEPDLISSSPIPRICYYNEEQKVFSIHDLSQSQNAQFNIGKFNTPKEFSFVFANNMLFLMGGED